MIYNLFNKKNIIEHVTIYLNLKKIVLFIFLSLFFFILIFFTNFKYNYLESKYVEPKLCKENCSTISLNIIYKDYIDNILLNNYLGNRKNDVPLINYYKEKINEKVFFENIFYSFFANVIEDKNYHNSFYQDNSLYFKHNISKIEINDGVLILYFNDNIKLNDFKFKFFKKDFDEYYNEWINKVYFKKINNQIYDFLVFSDLIIVNINSNAYKDTAVEKLILSFIKQEIYLNTYFNTYPGYLYSDLYKYISLIINKNKINEHKNNINKLNYFYSNIDFNSNNLIFNKDNIKREEEWTSLKILENFLIKNYISSLLISLSLTIFSMICLTLFTLYKYAKYN